MVETVWGQKGSGRRRAWRLYRRFPNLLYRRFSNRQPVRWDLLGESAAACSRRAEVPHGGGLYARRVL